MTGTIAECGAVALRKQRKLIIPLSYNLWLPLYLKIISSAYEEGSSGVQRLKFARDRTVTLTNSLLF